jgi:diguanylate cyclase (GGDEF)-like protein/PAS domain S-box-containing protein
LRKIEPQLESILSSLKDVVWSISATTFKTLYISPATEMVYGHSVPEFFKNPNLWLEVVHPDDQERVQSLLQTLLQVGSKDLEYRILRPDGEVRWIHNRAYLAHDASGAVIRVDGIATDITERKQAEEEKQKFISLVENSSDFIAMSSLDGKVLFVNEAGRQLVGLNSLEEALSKTITEYLAEEGLTQFYEMILPQILTTGRCEVEGQLRHFKSGKLIDVQRSCFAIWHPQTDEFLCFAMIQHDITERKQAEKKLRESEEQYRRIVNTAQEGIWVLDAQAKTSYVNQTMAEMLGYSPEGMLGRPLFDFMDAAACVEAKYYFERRKQGIKEQHDFRFSRQDGSELWAIISTNPMLGENGEFFGVLGMLTDITERKQVEEALHQQAARERLIAQMAQHIRQSLNLEEMLNTTVAEVRQFLQADRVIIYHFEANWNGVVVVESVADCWPSILGTAIHDPCFAESYVHLYQNGRVKATEDIYTAGLGECHIHLLAQVQVRANLVVPILQAEKLWGLLIAHQCSAPRQWQQLEIDLLQQLATQVAIAIQQSELYQQLQAANQELQHLATSDGLTQIANRRRFDEYLVREWQRLSREKAPLSLILCDVDCFKTYNDTYGHQAGDACLKKIAKALCHAVKRSVDLVARYGGEEFAVILPNIDTEGALQVTKKIQTEVRGLKIAHPHSLVSEYVTVSLGVATTVPHPKSSAATLIAAADMALYQAKAEGRDCIIPDITLKQFH